MKKLSTLVNDQVNISTASALDTVELTSSSLEKLINEVECINIDTQADIRDIRQTLERIRYEYKHIDDVLNNIRSNLSATISNEAKEYYQVSEQIYTESLTDSPEYTADRFLYGELISRPDQKEQFLERLKMYAGWQHPGLFIRPEKGDFVEPLIACDPLYVVDQSKELLLLVKEKWTEQFQSRIRYSIVDDSREKILKSIPDQQIGIIVAYHFFNYKPLNVIKRYLTECYHALKPGGVMVFTYNNCDLPDGVKKVESKFQMYTPASTLKVIIEAIGFELLYQFDLQHNVSWLEIKKPGELTTLRGGQSLAQIKDSRLDN